MPKLQPSYRPRVRLVQSGSADIRFDEVNAASLIDEVSGYEAQLEKAACLVGARDRASTIVGNYWRQDPDAWFKVMGSHWTHCNDIGHVRPELRKILLGAHRAQLDLMMDAKERAAFDCLPKFITIYRGCYPHNQSGLSWTLSRSIAERFPSLLGYHHGPDALLLTARVAKSRCVLKLGRSEEEVIVPVVRSKRVEALRAELIQN